MEKKTQSSQCLGYVVRLAGCNRCCSRWLSMTNWLAGIRHRRPWTIHIAFQIHRHDSSVMSTHDQVEPLDCRGMRIVGPARLMTIGIPKVLSSTLGALDTPPAPASRHLRFRLQTSTQDIAPAPIALPPPPATPWPSSSSSSGTYTSQTAPSTSPPRYTLLLLHVAIPVLALVSL